METRHQKIIQQILAKYPYNFYAYGSRVKGNAHKFSDLDICYQEEIPVRITSRIRWEFEESNLPFIIELVHWKNMRPAFQKAIKKDLTLLSAPSQIHSTK